MEHTAAPSTSSSRRSRVSRRWCVWHQQARSRMHAFNAQPGQQPTAVNPLNPAPAGAEQPSRRHSGGTPLAAEQPCALPRPRVRPHRCGGVHVREGRASKLRALSVVSCALSVVRCASSGRHTTVSTGLDCPSTRVCMPRLPCRRDTCAACMFQPPCTFPLVCAAGVPRPPAPQVPGAADWRWGSGRSSCPVPAFCLAAATMQPCTAAVMQLPSFPAPPLKSLDHLRPSKAPVSLPPCPRTPHPLAAPPWRTPCRPPCLLCDSVFRGPGPAHHRVQEAQVSTLLLLPGQCSARVAVAAGAPHSAAAAAPIHGGWAKQWARPVWASPVELDREAIARRSTPSEFPCRSGVPPLQLPAIGGQLHG